MNGQKIPSAPSILDKGIFLISSASLGTKTPSMKWWFHCLAEASIRTSSLASAKDSIMGERPKDCLSLVTKNPAKY